jgi:hypothetical protein
MFPEEQRGMLRRAHCGDTGRISPLKNFRKCTSREIDMNTNEIRSLSAEELETVSGASPYLSGYSYCTWPQEGLYVGDCPTPAGQAYVEAFLKGVEKGKGKGQKA